jgi:hypothetical protein
MVVVLAAGRAIRPQMQPIQVVLVVVLVLTIPV